ncbi:hypothetical protein CspeluHIS016_0103980 [Cutaneotrichosporon spelunceum]|uniref:Uncharacterized protein n=1 Tax=Cutaneotrichosporon spelunceum TaxID=1672016 RepID=A0AAD3Y9H5_9TREE|nr:hypothetical protein CspeluHIS016_0103980 [Cutaneotrichosporon spelunceum]
MAAIPLDTYPHILDSILAHAPYASLLALRTASRELRDRVDAHFVAHIAFFGPDICGALKGQQVRIPRAEWWDVPAVADAVRLVDICGTRQRLTLQPEHLCWCGGKAGDPRAAKLHRVQLVRKWTTVHWCPAIASPRCVVFVSELPTTYRVEPLYAPTVVFYCAPRKLWCRGVGYNQVVIRAQPSARNATDPSVLCLDIAEAICVAEGVTLVGFDELSFLRAWAGDKDLRTKIKDNVAKGLTFERFVDEDEAPGIVEQYLRIITEDEYRAETGEEMFALETFMFAPTADTWPQPRLVGGSAEESDQIAVA